MISFYSSLNNVMYEALLETAVWDHHMALPEVHRPICLKDCLNT